MHKSITRLPCSASRQLTSGHLRLEMRFCWLTEKANALMFIHLRRQRCALILGRTLTGVISQQAKPTKRSVADFSWLPIGWCSKSEPVYLLMIGCYEQFEQKSKLNWGCQRCPTASLPLDQEQNLQIKQHSIPRHRRVSTWTHVSLFQYRNFMKGGVTFSHRDRLCCCFHWCLLSLRRIFSS